MKTPLTGIAAILALAALVAPALAQPGQQLLGKWTCHTEAEGQVVNSSLEYKADGKATYDTHMTDEGIGVEIRGTGDVEWQFDAAGKLNETIKSLKVSSGKIGGQMMEAGALQAMAEPMIVGQSSVSTATFSGDTLTLVESAGVTTNCKR